MKPLMTFQPAANPDNYDCDKMKNVSFWEDIAFHVKWCVSNQRNILAFLMAVVFQLNTQAATVQQAYIKPNVNINLRQGTADYYGYSVAIDGDTMVMGAPGENSSSTGVNSTQNNYSELAGAAYVFKRIQSDSWALQAYLKASNTDENDQFGWSVAISGNTVVVGAIGEDSNASDVNPYSDPVEGSGQFNNSAESSGAAYVFTRSWINNIPTWSQQAYLKSDYTNASDLFGASVAISGNRIVVGAIHENTGTLGCAHVFTRNGTSWSNTANLVGSNTESPDYFGWSVGISGDVIVVGAPHESSGATGVNGDEGNNPSAFRSGAAYVFIRDLESYNTNSWVQQAYLKASNTGYNNKFGYSVAVSGGTIVVGAPWETSDANGVNGNGNSAVRVGAAYVFTQTSGNWSQQAYLKASDSEEYDEFGSSLSVSGNNVIVGAPGKRAAYVFVRSSNTWSQQAYLTPDPNRILDNFGHSVAITSNVLAIGAVYPEIFPGGSMNGSFVFPYQKVGVNLWISDPEPYVGFSQVDVADEFGASIAIDADTMVVGAPGEDSFFTGVHGYGSFNVNAYDNSAVNSGAAFVFTRWSGSWYLTAYLKASNTGVDDRFGISVAVSGGTIIVGADQESSNATGVNPASNAGASTGQFNNSASQSGAAYVFVWSGTAWSQQAYLKASNTEAEDFFGFSVSISGNTAVVGALGEDSNSNGINGNQADNTATNAGAAYVFVRNATTWSQQAYVKASNSDANDNFSTVAISANTLVVGALGEDSGTNGINGSQTSNSITDAGAAYIFTRSGSTWSQKAYVKSSNSDAYDLFGCSVAISSNTIVVGACGESSSSIGVGGNQTNNTAQSAGAAYVFVPSGATWIQQAYLKASNTQEADYFGWSVAVSGNNIAVGAIGEDSSSTGVGGNQSDNNASESGATYVFTRSGTVWSQQSYLKASNSNIDDWFGYSTAVSGNTVVTGAPQEHGNGTFESNNSMPRAGAGYVFTVN